MQQSDQSRSSERMPRRSLFSGRTTPTPPPYHDPIEQAEELMSAYQQVIQTQLEEGLRAIHRTANQLMHEIAGEVWRTAGGDKDAVQRTLLQEISKDQSLRSLIAHTDERFQTIAVRTARLEDTVNLIAEGMRAAKDQLARGVDTLAEVQASPSGVDELRSRLDEVTRQIALAFETLAGRDRAIVEAVQQRVREHGELVSTETAAIAKAMEAYVQQGVAAMGQLAGDIETRVGAIERWEEEADTLLARSAQEQVRLLDERIHAVAELLEHMHDRVGMETRDMLAAIDGVEARTSERLGNLPAEVAELARTVEERMGSVSEEFRIALDEKVSGELTRALETRTRGLAELVRADTSALREELVRTAAAQDEAIAHVLDERLGRVNESLSSATGWMVEEMSRRLHDDAVLTIRTRMDEAVSSIERHGDETARMLNGRLDDAVLAIDRNMVRMSDTLEGQVERISRAVGDRTAQAVEEATRSVADRTVRAMDEVVRTSQARTEDVLAQALDSRIASLAKMIRSDNESLGQQIMADQEASKQSLRAMKELQASLPADVVDTIQRRMDDLAESVAKSQEMLAQRIDRMAAKIGERYDNDMQVVIDRMGDAMHALAGLGRTPQQNVKADRIDLE